MKNFKLPKPNLILFLFPALLGLSPGHQGDPDPDPKETSSSPTLNAPSNAACGIPCPADACTPANIAKSQKACAAHPANQAFNGSLLSWQPEQNIAEFLMGNVAKKLPVKCLGPNKAAVTTRIKFDYLRGFLPQDGTEEVIQRGALKWPKNKNAFDRHESLEIAIGKGIRAAPKHRKKPPTFIGPGIAAHGDQIKVAIGWRAHRQTPCFPDYFDGTANLFLKPYVKHGKVSVQLVNAEVDWNVNLPPGFKKDANAALSRTVRGSMFRGDIENTLNSRIQSALAEVLQPQVGASLHDVRLENGDLITEMAFPMPACRSPTNK